MAGTAIAEIAVQIMKEVCLNMGNPGIEQLRERNHDLCLLSQKALRREAPAGQICIHLQSVF